MTGASGYANLRARGSVPLAYSCHFARQVGHLLNRVAVNLGYLRRELCGDEHVLAPHALCQGAQYALRLAHAIYGSRIPQVEP